MPARTKTIVSKLVPAPQVWIVATPDVVGAHWNTCSGPCGMPHEPESVLTPRCAPAVEPVTVAPAAGITTASSQAVTFLSAGTQSSVGFLASSVSGPNWLFTKRLVCFANFGRLACLT